MAKTRSPNYPFIPLPAAIDRARQVWAKEGRHAAAPETIVGHWGYGGKSSGGRQTIAALRHFGLLEGRGQLHLTELAQAILVAEDGSALWLERVQEAALRPSIHKELVAKYGYELPSEQNLRYHLVVERGFSEGGAAELIEEVRATFSFAKLAERTDSLSLDLADNDEDEEEIVSPTTVESPRQPAGMKAQARESSTGLRAIQLPYSAAKWAVLQAPFPLSPHEWDQMVAVLQAMKPGLVASQEQAYQPDAE